MKRLRGPSRLPNESPHPDRSLEWWFVHGTCEGPGIAERHFMVSLFRHGIDSGKSKNREGFSLICSIYVPETGTTRNFARIDRASFDYFLTLKPALQRMGLNNGLLNIYFDELRRGGPPRGIDLVDAEVADRMKPFSVIWEDFALYQSSESFHLVFGEPGGSGKYELELRPEGSRIAITDWLDVGGHGHGLWYNSYPRLSLTGQLGGKKISGRAWLDHQWGSLAFLMGGGKRPKALGWDWFGINFDNGTDWIVSVLRNMRSQRSFRKSITIRNPDDSIQNITDFRVKPAKYWESTKTNIRYPVGWKIEIPELKAKLTFQPLMENQEIPVFGMMRAIWEGTGTVTGTIGEKEVKGKARGEFQGYGCLFNGKNLFENLSRRIDRHIEEFLPKKIGQTSVRRYVGPSKWRLEPFAYTEMLSKPVWDLILRGGKKWRPTLAILLLDSLGTETAPYEALISAIAELTHTGSLIIDDIEDSSRLRRGDECIHLRYGQDVSINAANTIYFLPMLTLMNHRHLSERQRLKIHEIVMRQFIRAHFGQTLDLYWTGKMSSRSLQKWQEDSHSSKILQMYEFKSAAIVEGLIETVAIIARADTKIRNACVDFGRFLGVAFQIIDDIHNFSNSPKWRKERGEDLGAGKLTYVLFKAVQSLNGSAKKRLQDIICSEKLRKECKNIEEGVQLVQESGALEQCREEAKSLMEPARRTLTEILPASESKILLL